MAKRLFALRDTQHNRVGEPYFDDRMAAKAMRKQLNTRDSNGLEVLRYVVTYGPDHRLYRKEK
jgi:hypothetical protein